MDVINRLERQPIFQQFYRWLIPRSRVISRLIQAYAILVLLPLVIGVYVFATAPENYYPFFDTLARRLGQVAALLYCLTLVPGILRRFGILPLTRSVIMLWRRYLGIAMFHSAIVHQALIRTIPIVFINPRLVLTAENLQLQLGLLALLLLFPLWLTSNEWSVRTLGVGWHWIHKLTYLAVLAIFGHVVLSPNRTLALIVGVVLSLEIASWIVGWLRRPAGVSAPAEGGNPPAAPVQ